MSRHKRIVPLHEESAPAREGSVAAGYAVLLFLIDRYNREHPDRPYVRGGAA